jgi:hypothetical protein
MEFNPSSRYEQATSGMPRVPITHHHTSLRNSVVQKQSILSQEFTFQKSAMMHEINSINDVDKESRADKR